VELHNVLPWVAPMLSLNMKEAASILSLSRGCAGAMSSEETFKQMVLARMSLQSARGLKEVIDKLFPVESKQEEKSEWKRLYSTLTSVRLRLKQVMVHWYPGDNSHTLLSDWRLSLLSMRLKLRVQKTIDENQSARRREWGLEELPEESDHSRQALYRFHENLLIFLSEFGRQGPLNYPIQFKPPDNPSFGKEPFVQMEFAFSRQGAAAAAAAAAVADNKQLSVSKTAVEYEERAPPFPVAHKEAKFDAFYNLFCSLFGVPSLPREMIGHAGPGQLWINYEMFDPDVHGPWVELTEFDIY